MKNIELGDALFDEDGNKIGVITGVNEDGFSVSINEDAAGIDGQKMAKRAGAGHAELTWQCMGCGEVGEIDEMPDEGCPSCGAPKTDLFYAIQD